MSDAEMGPIVPETAITARGTEDPFLKAVADVNARLDRGRDARLALTDRVGTLERQPAPADPTAALAALAARIKTLEDRPVVRLVEVSGVAGPIALTGFASIISVVPRVAVTGPVAAPVITVGAASAILKSGFTAAVYRSKGTLLLTAGPFEVAPAGTSATFLVAGIAA